MKSPFPGMDPFIEAGGLWRDFHGHLIEKIFDAVSDVLPRGYLARTGKRSYLVLAESEEKVERHFEPDVSVSAPRGRKATPAPAGQTPMTVAGEAEPIALRAFIETEFAERFVDIYELEPERHLVTSIEVLSPSNKLRRSPGWKKYLRKRQALLLGKANLVEIDLLRGGDRLPMLDPLPGSPYYVLVARQEQAPMCRAWPASFDRPLPVVSIPLAKPDPDILLALQPLVEAVYARSRYGEDIDYSRPLTPPPTPELAERLAEWLRSGTSAVKPRSSRQRRRRKS
jgi:hypothetical protein